MRTMVLVAMVAMAGCVVDGPRRQTTRQPSDVSPAKLVPTASVEFVDTDGNRYRDSATVVVYVMGDIPAYHLPIRAVGTFELSLEDARGTVIAKWPFDKAKTAAALTVLQPGPGFVFSLDIRKSSLGRDAVDTPEGILVVTFVPEKGELIRARTSSPLLIGPVGLGRW